MIEQLPPMSIGGSDFPTLITHLSAVEVRQGSAKYPRNSRWDKNIRGYFVEVVQAQGQSPFHKIKICTYIKGGRPFPLYIWIGIVESCATHCRIIKSVSILEGKEGGLILVVTHILIA